MFKKGKLHLMLIVLTAMALLVAACGGGAAETPAPAPAEQGAAPEQAASSGPLKITMYGGSPGGLFALSGEGVGNIIRKNVEGSQYNLEPGNPLSNIMKMSSGEDPNGLALVHNLEIKVGLDGVEPFKQKVEEVNAIGTLYDTATYQFVLSKEFADKHGITSIEDIAAKKAPLRMAVLQRGNLVENVNRAVLEAHGVSYDNVASWGGQIFFENINTAVDMIKNNRLDAYAAFPTAPDSKLMELSTTKDVVIMSLSADALDKLSEQFNLRKTVLPAKTYEWQTEDVQTLSTSLVILASNSMSEEAAYTVTKTLVENIESVQAITKAMATLTPEVMTQVSPAKLHPGAEKFYKEQGLIK